MPRRRSKTHSFKCLIVYSHTVLLTVSFYLMIEGTLSLILNKVTFYIIKLLRTSADQPGNVVAILRNRGWTSVNQADNGVALVAKMGPSYANLFISYVEHQWTNVGYIATLNKENNERILSTPTFHPRRQLRNKIHHFIKYFNMIPILVESFPTSNNFIQTWQKHK